MFTIVTDSTAYLTKAEAEALGVQVAPMSYSISGYPFIEDYVDKNGSFVELLQNAENATTSQVSISTFLSIFNELKRKGKQILCLTISSRLSGTYANATMAAKELGDEQIIVVDSLSTAGGLRFLVEKACHLAKKSLSLSETANIIEQSRDQVGIAFSVDNMEALRKSGRIGSVRQSVDTILNLRPILLCKNGTVVAHRISKGIHDQITGLIDCIPKDATQIAVHLIRRNARTDAFEQAVREKFSVAVHTLILGPVLGVHLGVGLLGVSWYIDNAKMKN